MLFWGDAGKILPPLTHIFEAVHPQARPPVCFSLRPTENLSNSQRPLFTGRLSSPSHPQQHWPLCPPRVWVGSAVGLVWLAPKINSLADGRRRCAQARQKVWFWDEGWGRGSVCRRRVNMLIGSDQRPSSVLNTYSTCLSALCVTTPEKLGPRTLLTA